MRTGQKITNLRQRAGLTQEQLAEKLFVSRELVSKWETDKRYPSPETAAKLSALFGVSADEFTDGGRSVSEELSVCFPAEREMSEEQLTALLNSFLGTLSKTERLIFISRYYHKNKTFVQARTVIFGGLYRGRACGRDRVL